MLAHSDVMTPSYFCGNAGGHTSIGVWRNGLLIDSFQIHAVDSPGLAGENLRSNSNPHVLGIICHLCDQKGHRGGSGAGDRSRTYDLLITNELLYQLSYTGTGCAC